MRKNPFALVPVVLAFLTISGCGSPEQTGTEKIPEDSSPAFGDAVVEGVVSDALGLQPYGSTDAATTRVTSRIYQGLVKLDRNCEPVPDLAETWEISADGKTITFRLKQGILWHDGEEFTAKDAFFTYSNQLFYIAQFVETLEMLDNYSVRFHYQMPFAPALRQFAQPVIPEHVFKTHDNIYAPEYKNKAIGTGPYRFKQWRSGEELVLEASENYFEGRPYIQEYVFRVIPDPSTAFLALLRGELDILYITPDQYAKQVDNKNFRTQYNLIRYPSPSRITWIGYNSRGPFFNDLRVRRAMTMALDREAIIKEAFRGCASITDGPWPKNSWAYNSTMEILPYSPEKARLLVSEAGWKDLDGDGILEKDGRKFDCRIIFITGNKALELTAWMASSFWKEIGIKVSLKACDMQTLLTSRHHEDFDILLDEIGLPDPDLYYYFHWFESPIPGAKGGRNCVGYKNDEVSDLCQKGRTTLDREERIRIYHRLHELIYNDQPYTFLCSPDNLVAVSNRFRGVEASPAGIFHNYTRWYVPKQQQKYSIDRNQ
ncbi:MAG: peptide-binding protein [Candidatus Wallbacteria bacterium]|nr:peptide-binding protein [Candidatus Wallbacteria bacterium]